MALSSFTDVTELIKKALEGSSALETFCAVNLGGDLTVKKEYKKSTDVGLTELPIIMITAPQHDREIFTGGLIGRTSTVLLYCGFHQKDRSLGQDQFVLFEEEVIKALFADQGMKVEELNIIPGGSANDEGYFHPIYFFAIELTMFIEEVI